jgi:hypothetical protein
VPDLTWADNPGNTVEVPAAWNEPPLRVKEYSRSNFEACTGAEQVRLCYQLARLLSERLASISSVDGFLSAVEKILDDLRSVGHDFWNWDNPGAGQVWGFDYTKGGEGVVLEFYFPRWVRVTWHRTEPKRRWPA